MQGAQIAMVSLAVWLVEWKNHCQTARQIKMSLSTGAVLGQGHGMLDTGQNREHRLS